MEYRKMEELVDDILFTYDVAGGRMQFGGRYKRYLDLESCIPDFLNNARNRALFDAESQELMESLFHKRYEDGTLLEQNVMMLDKHNKYVLFRMKGMYDRNSNTILGLLKNTDYVRMAYTDDLTGLLNRRGLEKEIQKKTDDGCGSRKVALILTDIDDFKVVNDTMGHMAGDELIKQVATVLQEVFGEDALVARIGGDEFNIFLHQYVSREQLEQKLQSLCECIAALGNEEQAGTKNCGNMVTISVGAAVSGASEAYNIMFNQADIALYHAKETGKNGYRIYTDEMRMSEHKVPQRRDNVLDNSANSYKNIKTLLDGVIEILNDARTPREGIEQMAKMLVETLDVTRAYASCYTKDGSRIGRSYFYATDSDTNIPFQLALRSDDYAKNFNEEGILFCTDVTELSEPIRSELIRMKVESLLQILIYDGERIIGTLGINNCGYKRLWITDEIYLMHTIGKLLKNQILRLQEECEQD